MRFSHYKEEEFWEYISKLNMGLTLSTRRIRFNSYRFLARNLITPLSEIVLLKEKFCGLSGTRLSKLKNLLSFILRSSRKFTKI